MRGTLIVMPVFVLALTNPSFYLAAIMKTVALGQQAGETDARSAGRELVGSTLMGALIALGGLARPVAVAQPVDADAVADGRRAVGRVGAVRRPAHAFRPSFWSNALITALILLGPAIEDSASGKSVLEGAVDAHQPVRRRRALCLGHGLGARALARRGLPAAPRCNPHQRRKPHDLSGTFWSACR